MRNDAFFRKPTVLLGMCFFSVILYRFLCAFTWWNDKYYNLYFTVQGNASSKKNGNGFNAP